MIPYLGKKFPIESMGETRSKRILIVDDEPELGLLLSLRFSSMGYTVQVAQSLDHAERVLMEFEPDLLLLDLNLPDGQGYSLVPGARAKYPQIKVAVISAYGNSFDQELAEELNISEFFPKPFTDDDLIKWVENQE